jgi:hypothetical protein
MHRLTSLRASRSTTSSPLSARAFTLLCSSRSRRHNKVPRGFGFVTFRDPATAGLVASAGARHLLDGRQVEVKRALARDEVREDAPFGAYGGHAGVGSGSAGVAADGAASGARGSDDRGRSHAQPQQPVSDRCKLFVGGLAHTVTDPEFRGHFERYGRLLEAVIMIDRDSNRSRGFGFVTFAAEQNAAAALRDAHVLHGKNVDVKIAEPKSTSSEGRAGERQQRRAGPHGQSATAGYEAYQHGGYGRPHFAAPGREADGAAAPRTLYAPQAMLQYGYSPMHAQQQHMQQLQHFAARPYGPHVSRGPGSSAPPSPVSSAGEDAAAMLALSNSLGSMAMLPPSPPPGHVVVIPSSSSSSSSPMNVHGLSQSSVEGSPSRGRLAAHATGGFNPLQQPQQPGSMAFFPVATQSAAQSPAPAAGPYGYMAAPIAYHHYAAMQMQMQMLQHQQHMQQQQMHHQHQLQLQHQNANPPSERDQ